MILPLFWILITLALALGAGVLGKRFGVVYPIAFLAGLVVVANVVAAKTVVFGPFVVTAGIIAYSATFFITDMLSEVWGRKVAVQAVFAGFLTSFAAMVMIFIADMWSAPDFASEFSGSFHEVLGLVPRITLASLVAYIVSQYHDIWAFHFWKKKTNGRFLWLRNNLSTLVSQFIDAVLFITIAFAGVMPLLPLIAGTYAVKVIIALLDTPFLYAARAVLNRIEHNSKRST